MRELDLRNRTWSTFTIESLFDVKGTKTTLLNELKNKIESPIKYPYVTTKSDFMGIDGFFNYFTEKKAML